MWFYLKVVLSYQGTQFREKTITRTLFRFFELKIEGNTKKLVQVAVSLVIAWFGYSKNILIVKRIRHLIYMFFTVSSFSKIKQVCFVYFIHLDLYIIC